MSDLTRADVAHLASLARIDLSDAELDSLAGELTVILDSVAQVQRADLAGVEPMSHPHSIDAGMREDVEKKTLTQAEALDQAPAVEDDRFVVPQILGEGD